MESINTINSPKKTDHDKDLPKKRSIKRGTKKKLR